MTDMPPPIVAYVATSEMPAPRMTRKVRVFQREAARGYHTHICPCGEEFSHSDKSKDNVAAHTCPACNKVLPGDWQKDLKNTKVTAVEKVESVPVPQKNVTANPIVSPYSVPSLTNQDCPGGTCPPATGAASVGRGLFGRRK